MSPARRPFIFPVTGAFPPAEPGTYALLMQLQEPVTVQVGRLGQRVFPALTYVYAGSAHGPGGLRARVTRHLNGHGIRHWHIDFLRAYASISAVCFAVTPEPLECIWSHVLANLEHACIPVSGFGSSDCQNGCRSHLIGFSPKMTLKQIRNLLQSVCPPDIRVSRYVYARVSDDPAEDPASRVRLASI
jgi:Uri superfamily endonuclease